MSIFDSIILGVMQGVTEFVPVSSTGHLILARELFGLPLVGTLAFDAVLQLATALSIAVYFWDDIVNVCVALWRRVRRVRINSHEDDAGVLLFALAFGTLPAVVAGLLLESYMDTAFRTPVVVAVALVVGAVVMASAEYVGRQRDVLTKRGGFIVGLFQVLALIPGMSRSGSTIAGGLFVGLTRDAATRFAFLLGFPILFGSGIKKLIDIGTNGFGNVFLPLAIGSLTAFFVGLVVIHYLLRFLRGHTLYAFVAYRLALAVFVLVVL